MLFNAPGPRRSWPRPAVHRPKRASCPMRHGCARSFWRHASLTHTRARFARKMTICAWRTHLFQPCTPLTDLISAQLQTSHTTRKNRSTAGLTSSRPSSLPLSSCLGTCTPASSAASCSRLYNFLPLFSSPSVPLSSSMPWNLPPSHLLALAVVGEICGSAKSLGKPYPVKGFTASEDASRERLTVVTILFSFCSMPGALDISTLPCSRLRAFPSLFSHNLTTVPSDSNE